MSSSGAQHYQLNGRAKASCTPEAGRAKLVDVFSAQSKAFFDLAPGQRLGRCRIRQTQIEAWQAGSPMACSSKPCWSLRNCSRRFQMVWSECGLTLGC